MILQDITEEAMTVHEGDFVDPMLQDERQQVNYNTFDIGTSKKDKRKAQALQDAVDAKMAEFTDHKNKIPKPEVKHELEKQFKADINIFGVNLVAGGKSLLSQAQLRLVQGRKYGLVGRNGIGKTTLINAVSRGEIEKFPKGLHILQVEQEIDGDDISVLNHVLNCDVERNQLLRKKEQLEKMNDDNMSQEQKADVGH